VPFQSQTLSNGLQIIGETSPSARSVALGFFVRTGSRDETPEVSGVTHFLEHMVFKGTPRRTALDVNRDFDRIGANYNAFTSEENTVFYASILPEYLPQAVDILSDILRPSLREEDFDMEKNVIIEEIGMYEDQPMWSAYDHAKKLYFADHNLGNSILGTADSIRTLKREQMHAYFERRYVAPNVTVVAAGNYDWPHLVSQAQQHCGGWNSGPVGRKGIAETQGARKFNVMSKPKVTQEHVYLISSAPPANSPLRHAADTLAMIIGDDSGSRLYWVWPTRPTCRSTTTKEPDPFTPRLAASRVKRRRIWPSFATCLPKSRPRESRKRSCSLPRAKSAHAWSAAANDPWAACKPSAWPGRTCTSIARSTMSCRPSRQ
jgi:predicted Zn-dependent peptidase